jgi:hypothetical protein
MGARFPAPRIARIFQERLYQKQQLSPLFDEGKVAFNRIRTLGRLVAENPIVLPPSV